jgi:hypothetical protein
MPLRIDTGRLSDLARQRGQFQADASARAWQTLGALGEGTMGAYQGEKDRQLEEARAKSQDEYYDVMRRQNEAQLQSDKREREDEVEARNVMRRFVNPQGDVDYVALTQEVTGGDYSPGVARHVQSQVDAGLARVDQAAARELQSAESLRTELMKVAGDLDTVAQGSGRAEMYLLKQPDWFARAVELGMPEARAYELFPPDFNLQTVVSTADILRGQAAMAAKQEMAIGAGVSYFKGDLESIDDQQKLVMRSLAVDPDMTQEKLDAYWSDAAGDDRPSLDDRMLDLSTMGALGAAEKWEGFNKRTISPEVLAGFDDLRTFDEGWRERFEAHGDRIFTEEDKTLDQEIMTAFNNQDYPRLRALFAHQKNITRSKSNQDSDKSDEELADARVEPLSLSSLVEDLMSADRPDPDNPYGPRRRLEGDEIVASENRIIDAFRSNNGLMPQVVEADLMAGIENLIRSDPDGGVSEFKNVPWEGKEEWEAQVKFDIESARKRGVNWDHREAGKHREANVGGEMHAETIPIPESVIRAWAMEFFRSKKAEDLFPTASAYDVRRTLHAFKPGWDKEWRGAQQ